VRFHRIWAIGALLAANTASFAQQAAMCHATEDEATGVAPEKLPAPVKMEGIGNSSMTITANEEAKAWFSQGLNLLHDFWDYESAKAFEQAVRSDPQCAMCYWGLYKAEAFRSSDTPWAKPALDRAVALRKNVSKAEQLYIQAAKIENDEFIRQSKTQKKPSPKKKSVEPAKHIDSKQTKLLRKIVAMQPEDVQAKIFLAESLRDGFDAKGEPRPGMAEADAILEEILKQHPDDTAANHYWIHAMEPGNHPERALESAQKLGPLTPASGHMVHMPGHIFYRTGDYERARESFLNSMHVDEDYMRTQKVGVSDDWNYVHNLMYLIADLMEAGRLREAMEISGKLAKARGEAGPTLYQGVPRDGLTRLSVALPVLLRSGAWQSAARELEQSSPAPELKNLAELRASMIEYTRGMEALDRGDIKAASERSDALDARVKSAPAAKDEMPGMPMSKDAMARPVHSYLEVAAQELRASLLLAQGRGVESDAMFQKAAAGEKELGYREPPFSIRPVAETRGDALLRAKRFDEAKSAFAVALAQRPESGFALYGIAQADQGAGRRAETTRDYAHLLQAWARADADLPQLHTAHVWMERQVVDGE
jgi:tetratricopeptide (TPR) repeat protein